MLQEPKVPVRQGVATECPIHSPCCVVLLPSVLWKHMETPLVGGIFVLTGGYNG